VAVDTLQQVCKGEVPLEKLGAKLAADEGYFSLEEIESLQLAGVCIVISDPHAGRRRKDLPASKRAVLERGFRHVLDHGGMRRGTVRGVGNLSKRYVTTALTFNLSLLLRTIFGIGTPKQWLAASSKSLWNSRSQLLLRLTRLADRSLRGFHPFPLPIANFFHFCLVSRLCHENQGISTDC
jgi:hypothetical protein